MALATNRFGRNGERFGAAKPGTSGRRGEDRSRYREPVQRVVLDIRTNETSDRSRKRSRRRKNRSSSSESSSSRDRAKKDKQEIARLKDLVAKMEAAEQKREADSKQADTEAARRREMEDFKASVMALLPKQPVPSVQGAAPGTAMTTSPFTADGAQRASYFIHEVADLSGSASWDDVECKLKTASNTKLKEMLQRKGIDDVPSSKPAVVKAVMRILKAEYASSQ